MAPPEETELMRVAAVYAAATATRGQAMATLRQAIRQADAAGIPRLRIAELAQVSRTTVYDVIQEAGSL